MSIARTYRPVVARVIEPPCGPVDGLFITVRFEGQQPPFGRAGPCGVTSVRGSWRWRAGRGALFPRMESSKSPSHSSTALLEVMTKLAVRCLAMTSS